MGKEGGTNTDFERGYTDKTDTQINSHSCCESWGEYKRERMYQL
jgi:hypothetical protein